MTQDYNPNTNPLDPKGSWYWTGVDPRVNAATVTPEQPVASNIDGGTQSGGVYTGGGYTLPNASQPTGVAGTGASGTWGGYTPNPNPVSGLWAGANNGAPWSDEYGSNLTPQNRTAYDGYWRSTGANVPLPNQPHWLAPTVGQEGYVDRSNVPAEAWDAMRATGADMRAYGLGNAPGSTTAPSLPGIGVAPIFTAPTPQPQPTPTPTQPTPPPTRPTPTPPQPQPLPTPPTQPTPTTPIPTPPVLGPLPVTPRPAPTPRLPPITQPYPFDPQDPIDALAPMRMFENYKRTGRFYEIPGGYKPYTPPAVETRVVAPRTTQPGQSTNEVWESIITPRWNSHVERDGIGWDTDLTTDAARNANMASMVAEYDAIVRAPARADPMTQINPYYNRSQYRGAAGADSPDTAPDTYRPGAYRPGASGGK